MRMNWVINYHFCFAKLNDNHMEVIIRQTDDPTPQIVNRKKITFGFTKIESEKNYQAYIRHISDILFDNIIKNPQLLAELGSSLGDSFNEYSWIDSRKADMFQCLGKYPKQQDLADYLNVNKATVSVYPKQKKELMLHGLWLKKFLGDL